MQMKEYKELWWMPEGEFWLKQELKRIGRKTTIVVVFIVLSAFGIGFTMGFTWGFEKALSFFLREAEKFVNINSELISQYIMRAGM